MTKTIEFNKEDLSEVKKLRDADGLKWDEVGNAMGLSPGKAMLVYFFATVRPKDKVKNATPEDIVRLRDQENLSWGIISARTAYPESACRSMYEGTGRSAAGNKIGKGGRPAGSGGTTAKKAPADKKAPAAKKAPAPEPSPLDGLNASQVKELVTGFALKLQDDSTVAVKAVKAASKGKLVFTDGDNKARTIKMADVKVVSKKKVIQAA